MGSPTRLAHGVLALPPPPARTGSNAGRLRCGEPFEYVVPLSGAGAAQSGVEPQAVGTPPGPALALRGVARCSTVTTLRVEAGKFESVSTVQMPGGEVRRDSPLPPRDPPHAAWEGPGP